MTDTAAHEFVLAEVDDHTARYISHLVDTNTAEWIEDPQVEGVYGLRATYPGKPVLAVVYTNQVHWDFELSAVLEEDIAELA